MRVLLDVNVLVSGLLARPGAPALLLGKWLEGEFELVVTEHLLAELEATLARPKLRRHVRQGGGQRVPGALARSLRTGRGSRRGAHHHLERPKGQLSDRGGRVRARHASDRRRPPARTRRLDSRALPAHLSRQPLMRPTWNLGLAPRLSAPCRARSSSPGPTPRRRDRVPTVARGARPLDPSNRFLNCSITAGDHRPGSSHSRPEPST